MPRVAALIVAAVVLAVCATSAHAASTPCSFNPPIELNYWAGSPGQVSACFGTIPFNETRRSLVMEVVKQVFDAYSFGDLQQAPVGDYMNTVRSQRGLLFGVGPPHRWPSELVLHSLSARLTLFIASTIRAAGRLAHYLERYQYHLIRLRVPFLPRYALAYDLDLTFVPLLVPWEPVFSFLKEIPDWPSTETTHREVLFLPLILTSSTNEWIAYRSQCFVQPAWRCSYCVLRPPWLRSLLHYARVLP